MLEEIKTRWQGASRGPWQEGLTWRRIRNANGQLMAEIPDTGLTELEEQLNADAILHAWADVMWLIAEVERLSFPKTVYREFWEAAY